MTALLVVEDEDRIASFVQKGLQASGFTTTRAATGAEALQWVRRQDFDLVVLDLGLPDIDGIEVLRRLRAAGATVPVIVLTARDSVRDTIDGSTREPTTTSPNRSTSRSSWPGSGPGCARRRLPHPTCCRWGMPSSTCGPGEPESTIGRSS